MTGRTARDISTTVGGGAIRYPVNVPKGTIVRFQPYPNGGVWLVDEGFDAIEGCERGTIARHDAIHYGITIEPEDVTQFAPKGDETRRP